jgi:hypothetical protein
VEEKRGEGEREGGGGRKKEGEKGKIIGKKKGK